MGEGSQVGWEECSGADGGAGGVWASQSSLGAQ